MYQLLLFLFVLPAFGRPSSGQEVDIGTSEVANQLESLLSFTEETGKILNNDKLIQNVVESLLGTEQNIFEMEVDLKTLKYEVPELQIEVDGNYFPEYNEAKSYVRETRQGFRELAQKTVIEVRDLKLLMQDLNKNNDPFFLEISLGKIKDLMIKTQKTLNEADAKYEKAVQAFKKLTSNIKSKNEHLEKMLTNVADQRAWEKRVKQAATEACKGKTDEGFLGFLKNLDKKIGLGLDNLIEHNCPAYVEAEISKFEAELRNLKTITETMLESGDIFYETIQEAVEILAGEIEQIGMRTETAGDIRKNVDNNPDEFLEEYQTVETAFTSGLEDLKIASEKFMSQPKYILSKN